jgi:hypothetical protein
MGYRETEVRRAIAQVPPEAGLDLEFVLRRALQVLAKPVA